MSALDRALRCEAPEGTEVELQETNTLNFHKGVVDEYEVVRDPDNGATFNAENFVVVEIDE